MAATVSDFMMDRLGQWGVERIYGYAQALLKRDPEALGIVWQSVKEGMQGILPSRN